MDLTITLQDVIMQCALEMAAGEPGFSVQAVVSRRPPLGSWLTVADVPDQVAAPVQLLADGELTIAAPAPFQYVYFYRPTDGALVCWYNAGVVVQPGDSLSIRLG